MLVVAYVLVTLFVSFGTGSRPNVTFAGKRVTDPCARGAEVLVFATSAADSTRIDHRFRLNCTNTLFTVKGLDGTAIWREPSLKGDLTTELLFFRHQAVLLQTAFSLVLGSRSVELIYEFDTATGGYTFSILLDREPVSRCVNRTVSYAPRLGELSQKTADVVKTYAVGKGIELLRQRSETLGLVWKNFCNFLRAQDDRKTDVYDFYSDPRTDNVICLITSRVPWRHLIFLGRKPPIRINRSYDPENRTHSTVGIEDSRNVDAPVCRITFPDGTDAVMELRRPVVPTRPPSPTSSFAEPGATEAVTRSDEGTTRWDPLEGLVVPDTTIVAAAVASTVTVFVGLGLFVVGMRVLRFGAWRRVDLE